MEWRRWLLLGFAAAAVLVTLGAIGVTATATAPVWSFLVGPFTLVLTPGLLIAQQVPVQARPDLALALLFSLLLWGVILAWVFRAFLDAGAGSTRRGGSG